MSVPSGVKIDGKGVITIYFAFSDTKYTLQASEVLQHINYRPESSAVAGASGTSDLAAVAAPPSVTTATVATAVATSCGNSNMGTSSDRIRQLLPVPLPPAATAATLSSLTVQWEHALPKSPGISQNVEIQYTAASRLPLFQRNRNRNSSGHRRGSSSNDRASSTLASAAAAEDDDDDEDDGTEEDAPDYADAEEIPADQCGRYKWSALVSKSFSQREFVSFKWTGLLPGQRFRFRMRYRTNTGAVL